MQKRLDNITIKCFINPLWSIRFVSDTNILLLFYIRKSSDFEVVSIYYQNPKQWFENWE